MAEWDEIKRLAADFQQIQLVSTTQRLSERNWVEIVMCIIDQNLIQLIFSTDGKECITPAQLVKDIRNELYASGGRINIFDLAKVLNVDISHIKNSMSDVLKGHKDIHYILDQLIHSIYIQNMLMEINERLKQYGQVHVSDLSMHYDLPADFLQSRVLEKHLGKELQAKQDRHDSRLFYTEEFLSRCIHKIRGALNATTRPISINILLKEIEITEKLFSSLITEVTPNGYLNGRTAGAEYVPNVYAQLQATWVHNFYKQNDYLEYDGLTRLGIHDHKPYIRKELTNEQYHFLNSCVISYRIVEKFEANVEDCIHSQSFVNIQNSLPSILNDKDIEIILNLVLSKEKQKTVIIIDKYIISKTYVDKLVSKCSNMLRMEAKKVVQSGQYQQHMVQSKKSLAADHQIEEISKRDERRRKAAAGKSGGGTQGRETKTKSTKKSFQRHTTTSFSEDDKLEAKLRIVESDRISTELESIFIEDNLEEISTELIENILPILNEQGLQLAEQIYATTVADKTADRRNVHNDLQEKLNTLVSSVRLFEKGAKLVPPELQIQLNKYLLKTICADILNEILNYIIIYERELTIQITSYTIEQKQKFINDLGSDYKQLGTVLKTLQDQNVGEFLSHIDDGLHCVSMIVKKIDKKKDRNFIQNHKQQLIERLQTCEDLPLVLHLTVLLIFIGATQSILHASGKHVPSILSFLREYLSQEDANELTLYLELVTSMLSGGPNVDNVKEKLKEKVPILQNIAINYKKASSQDKT